MERMRSPPKQLSIPNARSTRSANKFTPSVSSYRLWSHWQASGPRGFKSLYPPASPRAGLDNSRSAAGPSRARAVRKQYPSGFTVFKKILNGCRSRWTSLSGVVPSGALFRMKPATGTIVTGDLQHIVTGTGRPLGARLHEQVTVCGNRGQSKSNRFFCGLPIN